MSKVKQLSALLSGMEVIDLSHTLEEDMQIYPTHSRYYHTLWDSQATGSEALLYQLIINEHCGTHMDATAHFIKEGHPAHQFMDETPVTQFFGRALTMDFSHYTHKDLVTAGEIEQWERENMPIEPGDIVLFRFGWDKHWVPRSISLRYGQEWPGLTEAAAKLLVARGIKAVGCDAIAIDGSESEGSPAHYALLGNGVNIIENLTKLDRVLGESYLFVSPLKVKEGSGSPLRAIAFK